MSESQVAPSRPETSSETPQEPKRPGRPKGSRNDPVAGLMRAIDRLLEDDPKAYRDLDADQRLALREKVRELRRFGRQAHWSLG